jgi:putative PIN family toxin of toxin-antitoxin system
MSASTPPNRLRATVDTNLFVSGLLIRPDSLPARLVDAVIAGSFTLVTSPALDAGVAEVLTRPKLTERYQIDPTIQHALLDRIATVEHVIPSPPLPITVRDPKDEKLLACALAGGVAYLTEDRKRRGLFPLMTTSANMTISRVAAFARFALLSLAREREAVTAAARDVGVRATALDQLAGTLSGGNQQKALVARYLLRHPMVLILDEPTRGVDVGARAEIYALMNRLTAQGMAILMISSDLPEVLGMSDRIVVMREGRVSGELPRGAATPDAVMALATRA